MQAPRFNLELKARCRNLDAAREAAIRLGARPVGVLIQEDTYFPASAGRLKLRLIQGESAELIFYERPNDPAVRASRYLRVPVPDPVSLKAALAAALGVSSVVRKHRHLLRWQNVRIHLDLVEDLGSFVEFEAVLSDDEHEDASRRRLEQLTEALKIPPDDRLAGSYGELISSKTT